MTAFCKCASPAPATKASGKFSKVIYLFMILFSCVFALVMQNYGAPQIKMSYWTVGCSTVTDVAACKGDGAVYRISMGTFLWFAGLMLGTLVVNEKMHNGYWGPKILIYLIFVGGSFFIKNDVFGAGNAGGAIAGNSGYALFARIASSFFLIFQIVAFIDFAYKWNNSWVGKSNDLEEEEDGKGRKWLGAILAACAGMYIVFFIWIIYLFANYSNTDGPELMFICVTAIGVVVITGMQLSIAETDGSLLTSAVVSLYSVYLCWSAVSGANRTDSKSNPASVWLGFAVAAFSLTWTCYSASVSATTITSGPTAAEDEATEANTKFNEDSATDKTQKQSDIDSKTTKKTSDEQTLSEKKSDLSGTQKELDAGLQYYEKLKPQCIDSGVSFEDRVARRKEEIASLQQALSILEGDAVA